MNTDAPTPPADKPKRKRRSVTPRSAAAQPRKERVIDPGVKAIRDEASARVREYHKAQASARVLATITDKLLPKLTDCESTAVLLERARREAKAPVKFNPTGEAA
jgi:hypothetical protein